MQGQEMSYRDLLKRGYERMRSGNLIGAIEDYTRAIALDQNDVDGYLLRGIAYMHNHMVGEAINDLTEVIDRAPQHKGALVTRGNAFARLGILDRAVQDLSQAAEVDPEDEDTFVFRADVWIRLKEYEKAGADFVQAEALAPKDVRVLVPYARFLATAEPEDSRNSERALELAHRGVKEQVTWATLDALALAEAEAGQQEHALETIQHAINAVTEGAPRSTRVYLEQHQQAIQAGEPIRR